MPNRLLKIPEARERLNVSNATFYRRLKDDPRFPKLLKIGSSSFISERALEDYIEALAEDVGPAQ